MIFLNPEEEESRANEEATQNESVIIKNKWTIISML